MQILKLVNMLAILMRGDKMKSCFDCRNLLHRKHTLSGAQPVCGLPGVPVNWNEKEKRYKDIASRCDDYKPFIEGAG